MKIVAGLGNPGPKYETTRHNVGFLAIDRLVDEWQAKGPQDSQEAEVWQASVRGEKVLLVKPQTFMNNSGRSIGPLMKFYKCEPTDLVVIHDEVDLPPRTLRIKSGGGTGGHNGLKSVDAHLGAGATGYHRIRVGVGRPGMVGVESKTRDTAAYVLEQFTDMEIAELDDTLGRIAQATTRILDGDVKGAMNEFNRRPDGTATNGGE